jgi:hypothetical protein
LKNEVKGVMTDAVPKLTIRATLISVLRMQASDTVAWQSPPIYRDEDLLAKKEINIGTRLVRGLVKAFGG